MPACDRRTDERTDGWTDTRRRLVPGDCMVEAVFRANICRWKLATKDKAIFDIRQRLPVSRIEHTNKKRLKRLNV